jgi:hypothetical protein
VVIKLIHQTFELPDRVFMLKDKVTGEVAFVEADSYKDAKNIGMELFLFSEEPRKTINVIMKG